MKRSSVGKKMREDWKMEEQLDEGLAGRNIVTVLIALLLYAVLIDTTGPGHPWSGLLLIGLITGVFAQSDLARLYAGAIGGTVGPLIFGTSRHLEIGGAQVVLYPAIVVLAALATGLIDRLFSRRQLVSLVIGALLVSNFLASSLHFSDVLRAQVADEPEAESYDFDGHIYLRVFYLLEKGELSYYEAYDRAVIEDKRFDEGNRPLHIFGYRLPTIFYIWSILMPANGTVIVGLFMGFSVLIMLASAAAIRRFSSAEHGLVGMALLTPYLLYASSTWWFVFVEYWGAFLAHFGLVMFLLGSVTGSLSFAIAAVTIKEQTMYLAGAGFLSSIIKKKFLMALLWLAPLLVLVLLLFLAYMRLSAHLGFSALARASSVVSAWEPSLLWKMLIFGTPIIARAEIIMASLFVLAFVGLSALAPDKRAFGFFFITLPIVFLPWAGVDTSWGGSDYWGSMITLSVMTLAPLGLSRVEELITASVSGPKRL